MAAVNGEDYFAPGDTNVGIRPCWKGVKKALPMEKLQMRAFWRQWHQLMLQAQPTDVLAGV